tara:strand:+ start:2260 stop:2979 length:720 start_codon:yes stop_codon:yes gene_type:complete
MNDNRNQNNGQPNQGQGNAEDSAKYFQSERDKLYAENQQLKKYEKIGKFLESRPDAAQAVANTIKKGPGQPKQAMPKRVPGRIAKPENFDPWEAYNDPSSASYKFRQQEMQDQVVRTSSAVIKNTVGKQMANMQQNQAMGKLTEELKGRGMTNEQISSFMEFASKNPAEYGLEGVINMWQSVGGQQAAQSQKPLDNVRQTQKTPATGGILQGQNFQAKSSEDEMWEGIKSAGGVGNKLP